MPPDSAWEPPQVNLQCDRFDLHWRNVVFSKYSANGPSSSARQLKNSLRSRCCQRDNKYIDRSTRNLSKWSKHTSQNKFSIHNTVLRKGIIVKHLQIMKHTGDLATSFRIIYLFKRKRNPFNNWIRSSTPPKSWSVRLKAHSSQSGSALPSRTTVWFNTFKLSSFLMQPFWVLLSFFVLRFYLVSYYNFLSAFSYVHLRFD